MKTKNILLLGAIVPFLFITSISSSSLADSFYVRKTVTQGKVPAAISNKLSNQVAEAMDQLGNYSRANHSSDADVTLLPSIRVDSHGAYNLTLKRTQGGRVLKTATADAVTGENISDTLSAMVRRVVPTRSAAELPAVTKTNEVKNSANSPQPASSIAQSEEIVAVNDEASSRVTSFDQNSSDSGNNSSTETEVGSIVKHWYVGLGPVWSTALVGSDGTKYNVSLAYNQALKEHLNLLFIYDGNFNSASQGKSDISTFGAGVNYFFSDRLAPTSLFAGADAGYGGSNRNQVGGLEGAASLGFQFFRSKSFNFEAVIRYAMIFTAETANGVSANPNVTQFRFGVYF